VGDGKFLRLEDTAMTKFQQWHMKNDMLWANGIANFIGVVLVEDFLMAGDGPLPQGVAQNPVFRVFDAAFTPAAFAFVFIMTLIYERPIRTYLQATFENRTISIDLERTARRRVLNEPFVLMLISFSMWLLAAFLYPVMYWILGVGTYWMERSCFSSLSTGLVTVTVAFFLLEHVLQKQLAPHFFPNGGLYTIPRTLRIRIRTRLAALLFACNWIPLLTIVLLIHRLTSAPADPALALGTLRSSVFINAATFLVSGALIAMLVSRNLTTPFGEIIQTLRGVRNGNFDKKVLVTSNDEIGYTGDVINEMTEGLKEREQMRQRLDLAKEVQQHLLPDKNPLVPGLDIAGISIYCEETGGDYYDYLPRKTAHDKKIAVVVGDVSGHGISSALLMTTVRAFLRQGSSRPGNLDQLVMEVNRQLAGDVKESGRFMTLFLGEIDRQNERILWVNAGHEPGLVYDLATKDFAELKGSGLPLGVSADSTYREFSREFKAGQILFIGTDGIWESRDSEGNMFGKDRFKQLVRQHANQSATQLIETVIQSIEEFTDQHEKSDDITLVVIKFVE
jgi:sigma-B regulation protein RsbU (phosphoserine phosphatase)